MVTTIQSNLSDASVIKNSLGDLIPLGWDTEKVSGFWAWVSKVCGLLITMFAVSLGAPFWYDLLCKVANIRNSVKPLTAKETKKKK